MPFSRNSRSKSALGQRILLDALIHHAAATTSRLPASSSTTLVVLDPASIPAQIINSSLVVQARRSHRKTR